MNTNKFIKIACALGMSLSVVACASNNATEEKMNFEPGATVFESEDSPSGYMVHFAYQPEKEVKEVKVTGPFEYVDPNLDLHDEKNMYSPYEYKAGMYATNCAPGPFTWGYTENLTLNEETKTYELEFPITSGSFAYSYIVTYEDGTEETIADPANPSPAAENTKSNIATGDITHSIVYGKFDEEKQAGSPNLDFVLKSDNKGTLEYVEYKGNLADDQDLGIYTPKGYDANRKEPYQVVYMSHGGGGNETDWFAMGHADNIVANSSKDVIVVTMDNSSYEWDFEKIEDNVLNYIIPYVEANYSVSKDAKDRAFCGLSMGSMTTFHMFYDHATEFGYFGAYSGPDMTAIKEGAPGTDTTPLYITVGTCDIASANIMPNDDETKKKKYEDFKEYLEGHPMKNVIDGGYIKGSHDWFVWSQSFYTFLNDIAFK
ncbi:MAG: alpha/beta hydrolase-fold protein [Bacillota bacterium]|nr:alpha/beta hydrolase-fold protein [Bacillota bacterium]